MKKSPKWKLSKQSQKSKRPKKCPNCGKDGTHFVPPSFGDKGFFICGNIEEKEEVILPNNTNSKGA